MARTRGIPPTNPRIVIRTAQTRPSFQRVTIGGTDLAGLKPMGFDQWFRLFVPQKVGAGVHLPGVTASSWWRHYLAIPKKSRPQCSNYTLAEFRHDGPDIEIDIDVVLHRNDEGRMGGGIAEWATSTRPGEPVALLDQGRLFAPPDDAAEIHLIADETGVPAVRGILRDLPPDTLGSAIIETASPRDAEPLSAPPRMSVTWLARSGEAATPGSAALTELAARAAPDPGAYGFVIGESALAARGRRLLHQAGLPKSRITFSGFWRRVPHR